MSEWWTYRLSDFLLFSARTYERLIEAYNAAVWPAQLVGLALGVVALLLAARRSSREAEPARGRAVSVILAAGWLWVAIAFFARRYATINWAASWFAWAFGLEAALLLALGAAAGPVRFDGASPLSRRAGAGLVFFALAVEPLLGAVGGRGWRQAEVFGVLPDPTAIATLGFLLLARFRGRWSLLLVPAVWCGVSGATLLALKSPIWWVAPAAAVVAIPFVWVVAPPGLRSRD